MAKPTTKELQLVEEAMTLMQTSADNFAAAVSKLSVCSVIENGDWGKLFAAQKTLNLIAEKMRKQNRLLNPAKESLRDQAAS